MRLNDVCSPSAYRERKTLVVHARDMDIGKRPLLVKYVILGPPPLENQKKKFSENKLIKAKNWYSGVKNWPNVMCQIWVHPKAEGIDDLIWNVNKESSLILPMQWSPNSILILIQFCAALNIFLLEPTTYIICAQVLNGPNLHFCHSRRNLFINSLYLSP